MIRNKPQPKRNPTDGPYASLRKTYWPPARGHMAASSAQQSAPVIVSKPASPQAASNHPGDPTRRADSAEVMKMPEPIIDPTTIIVASSSENPRTSFGDECLGASLMNSRGYSWCDAPMSREFIIVRQTSVCRRYVQLNPRQTEVCRTSKPLCLTLHPSPNSLACLIFGRFFANRIH